jgi:alkylated DNA repair dioxygenase AlkB
MKRTESQPLLASPEPALPPAWRALGGQRLPLHDADVLFLPRLPLALADERVLERLIDETPWEAHAITLWGKRYLQPRLLSWQGSAAYRYSGMSLTPRPMSALVLDIKAAVEAICGSSFNTVLLNYYRDGRDSMGMHSDDEPELGPAPVIASVSFGATRRFALQHKSDKTRFKIDLPTGSLLLMSGQTQANWLHGIAKVARPIGPRVNLTFRNII